MHQDGVLSDEQLETQIKFAYETATYMSKVACLHDVGEFLGELLGNNMKGKLDREEDIYRTLRNPVEDHVADVVVMREVSKQLKTGPLKGRWLKMDVNGYLDATLHRPGGFDFNTSFYSTCFKATERQQTNKEIVDNNEVGRINQEGYYESSPTLALDDVRFTMQYIYSKITGHKFKTTDPLEIAQFHDALYWQKREKDDFLRANRVAQDTGVALPHNPDVTRLKDLDHTSLPLDVYMDERDIDYENSLFKKFVDQTLKNYKTLPLEVARARQMHDEALLYAQCYEMNHYTKRHARVCGLDPSKVDKAVRKSIGQGVTMAQADLAKRGLAEVGYKIGLEHLEVPDEILGMQRYRWGSFNTTDTLLGDPEKPEQHFEPLQAATENIGLVFKAAHNGFLKPFMDLVRTPAQLMLLVANENISDKDIRRLYEVTAANELGGDLGIAAQGAAQSGVEGLDDKVFALANPVLTMLLASPQRQAEAVEKCYGHVLNLYSHQIAKKYGIEDVMPLLRKREYLKKGPYHKRPTDMKLSGIMSEDMYRYYSARYKGREDGPPIHAEYERAERYVLHEIIISEVGKLAGRLAQETNPAQKLVLGERLEKLRAANDRIATDMFFHTAGKHYSELRFGMIGTLGLMFAGSGVGSTFGIPFTDMHMTTSAVYGLNLALAGFSACAASLAERQRQLSCNNILRRIFTNLPHFEKGPKGGLYIVKGARHKPSKRAYEDFDYARKALIKEPQKSGPNFLVQFGDTLIAIPVTAVRALSNRATSSMAFANQGTAQLVDTGGVLVANGTKLVQGVAGPADALQAAASLLSTHSFNWTTAMNMHMHEMSENIAKGKDFDPESARQKNRDLIRAGGNEAIMNAMSNIARKTRGTPIGWLGRQMNRVAFNRVISDLTHSVLDRRERKRLAQAAAAASQPDQSYD